MGSGITAALPARSLAPGFNSIDETAPASVFKEGNEPAPNEALGMSEPLNVVSLDWLGGPPGAESSGFPALDSAAVRGSAELRFVPAKLRGEPMGITVLFPVYFRHPDARALPGDSILNTQRPVH